MLLILINNIRLYQILSHPNHNTIFSPIYLIILISFVLFTAISCSIPCGPQLSIGEKLSCGALTRAKINKDATIEKNGNIFLFKLVLFYSFSSLIYIYFYLLVIANYIIIFPDI